MPDARAPWKWRRRAIACRSAEGLRPGAERAGGLRTAGDLRHGLYSAGGNPGRGDISLGQRVFHSKFGYGTVAEIEGNKLEIDFEHAGRKRVLDSFVSVN